MRISATQFKANCYQILDEVAASGEPVDITKHRKVVAHLVPVDKPKRLGFGFAKDWMKITGDIMEPTNEDWEVLRDDARPFPD